MLFKQELIMQTGFFSISPTHKTTCTNNTVFPQNLHVINQEGKHITGFSFQLSNKKNRMHYYHFSHINFMQSNKENEHADWIFFFPDLQFKKQHANEYFSLQNLHVIQARINHANWVFFHISSSENYMH